MPPTRSLKFDIPATGGCCGSHSICMVGDPLQATSKSDVIVSSIERCTPIVPDQPDHLIR